ncbi:hypothetical protein BGZ59_009951 [Podila verticillata]|nr:hypothetical protein BGZ59_009951 [Podila verticillata]
MLDDFFRTDPIANIYDKLLVKNMIGNNQALFHEDNFIYRTIMLKHLPAMFVQIIIGSSDRGMEEPLEKSLSEKHRSWR